MEKFRNRLVKIYQNNIDLVLLILKLKFPYQKYMLSIFQLFIANRSMTEKILY